MLNVSPKKSRAAVISFGKELEIVSKFNNNPTVAEFETLVDNAVLKGGSRQIDKALKVAVQTAKQGRYDHPKIVILITAGKHGNGDLAKFRQALKELGVKSYVIAITQDVDKKSFLPLVDRPDDVFYVDSFNSLQSVARPIAHKLSRSIGK